LGWLRLYHHVKLAPGKAVGCGFVDGKVVFCLPGGPSASQMAFLQLALPALLKMAGHPDPQLPWLMAELTGDVTGQPDWTQFVEGQVAVTARGVEFAPHKLSSRLQSMAHADGLVMIPSGTASMPTGTMVPVQLWPGVLQSQPNPSQTREAATALTPEQTTRTDTPPVVSFVAKSGTGKTTFLEQLIPGLVARGLRVGVLKHHSHPTPFDVPGKDTYRLAQAGAQVVVGACSVQVAVFRQEDGAANLEAVIARHFSDCNLVLTEGFKRGKYPKVEVHRGAHSPELLCTPTELLALVTDEQFQIECPQFALTDVAGVADFLCDWCRDQKRAPGTDRT
jgi:molybdopterin-guanine dinucleotide biosynthesis protein MobB